MLAHHGREELLLVQTCEDYSSGEEMKRGIVADFGGRFRYFFKATTCWQTLLLAAGAALGAPNCRRFGPTPGVHSELGPKR